MNTMAPMIMLRISEIITDLIRNSSKNNGSTKLQNEIIVKKSFCSAFLYCFIATPMISIKQKRDRIGISVPAL